MQRLVVIVPVLNEGARVATLLRSLAAARAQGAQLIVVDGGSTDGTVRVAQPWCDRVIHGERGRGAQLAAGISASQRPFIWLLHADSALPNDAAAAVVATLARGTAIWGRFDIALSGNDARLRVIASLMNLRTRLTGIVTGDHGVFLRRELLLVVGGMPAYPLMEDIELAKRLRRVAWPIALSATITTSSRRWLQQGICRTVLGMWWLRLRYFVGASPADLARKYYGE